MASNSLYPPRQLPRSVQEDDFMWALALGRLETAVMCRLHAPDNRHINFDQRLPKQKGGSAETKRKGS